MKNHTKEIQKTPTLAQFERSLISQQRVLIEGGAYETRDLEILSVVLEQLDQMALQALSPFIERKASTYQRELLSLIVQLAYQRIKSFSYWLEDSHSDLINLDGFEAREDLPELRINLLKSQLETIFRALQDNQALPDTLYQMLIQSILFFKEISTKIRLINVARKIGMSGVERVVCYRVIQFTLEHKEELYSRCYPVSG